MSFYSSNWGFYKNCSLQEQLQIYTNLNKSILTALGIVKLGSCKDDWSEYTLINLAGKPKDEYSVNSIILEFHRIGTDVKQTANFLDTIIQISGFFLA